MHFTRRTLTRLVAAVFALLVASPARAQTPALAADPEAVQLAAQIALAQGVDWLKRQSTNDADGWITGPGRYSKVIGYTNVTVRYRQVTVDRPIFEYSNLVTFVQASPTEPPRKVVERRPVRQIGTKPITQVVGDREGPIVRNETHPVYQRGGNLYWRASGLGDAALVVHALRQAGVPDEDPVVQRMVENLRGHLEQYGLPDETWNLAWLTTVFAETPGPEAADLTERLTGRLLDGQIADGAARGLWGPLCVQPRLLAVLLRDYLALLADIQKKEQRLKLKEGKAARAALEQAQAALDQHRNVMKGVARMGTQFSRAELPSIEDPNADPVVRFAGASHFFYNQTAADVESTWAALFALSTAAGQRRLPTQTWRPKPSRPVGASGGAAPAANAALPRPETAEAVLARAANALATRQLKDGRWDECNAHQAVTDFDAFSGTLPVPADPKSFPPLPSAVTPLSTAQGIGALDNVGRAVGMARLLRSFQTPYALGLNGRQKELASWLATSRPKAGVRPRLSLEDYALFLTLARPLSSGGSGGETATAGDTEMTMRLVLGGTPDGAWGRGLPWRFSASSTRARLEALKPLTARVWVGSQPVEMNRAHLWLYNVDLAGSFEGSPIARDGAAYATAVAVLYLASHVPDPAATLREWADKPALADERATIELTLLGKRAPKPVAAPPPPPPPVPAATPVATPDALTSAIPAKAEAPASPVVQTPPDAIVPADLDVPALPSEPVEAAPKADESF